MIYLKLEKVLKMFVGLNRLGLKMCMRNGFDQVNTFVKTNIAILVVEERVSP